MVSRICRGVAKAACADAYVEHLRAETFPAQVQEMMVEWERAVQHYQEVE